MPVTDSPVQVRCCMDLEAVVGTLAPRLLAYACAKTGTEASPKMWRRMPAPRSSTAGAARVRLIRLKPSPLQSPNAALVALLAALLHRS